VFGDLDPELLGGEVEALDAGLAVGVVAGQRAQDVVLGPAVAAADVPAEGVGRLDLVRATDREQLLLPDPERVERRRRRHDVVGRQLRQQGRHDLRAQELREHHHVVLHRLVGGVGGTGLELAVLHHELDRELAAHATAGVHGVEVRLVAGGERVADDGGGPAGRGDHPEADRGAVEPGARLRCAAAGLTAVPCRLLGAGTGVGGLVVVVTTAAGGGDEHQREEQRRRAQPSVPHVGPPWVEWM